MKQNYQEPEFCPMPSEMAAGLSGVVFEEVSFLLRLAGGAGGAGGEYGAAKNNDD
jgi:hypothetical protein